MEDVTTLYDDLVAIRSTAQVLQEELSQEPRDDLRVVVSRIEGRLAATLAAMPDEERYDLLYALDIVYGGEVRAEFEAMLSTAT